MPDIQPPEAIQPQTEVQAKLPPSQSQHSEADNSHLEQVVKIVKDTVQGEERATINKLAGTQQNEQHEVNNPTKESVFQVINANIRALVDRISNKEGNVDEQKKLLAEMLRTRESFYISVAQAINPDIHQVEGRNNLYQVGEQKLYGSIIAVLDATQNLADHSGLAERVRMKVSSGGQTVMGERLAPNTFESAIVFSGSSAQSRIQPYGADIDMAEQVKIEAGTGREAATLLAQAIRGSVSEQTQILDRNGNPITLNFWGLKVGGSYPVDTALDSRGQAMGVDRRLYWTIAEINQGYLEYLTTGHEKKVITFEQACQNPNFLKVDYIGVTGDTVVEVTKVSTVQAVTPSGETLFSNVTGQATAFQEIYFDDPTAFGILDEVLDPDKYMGYVKGMEKEVRIYSNSDHLNRLKVAKRLYNLCKAEGDIGLVQEIAPLFSMNSAAIYQMIDRLGVAESAAQMGINVSEQRAHMEATLLTLLSASSNPQSLELVKTIQGLGGVDQMRKIAMQMVNHDVEQYTTIEHPNIANRIKRITSS